MIHNISWTAPIEPAPHGLLQSPDWWVWLAYLIVLPAAWCLMPGQMRESVKALWAPVRRWLAGLHWPSRVEWVFALTCDFGVIRPLLWDNWPEDDAGEDDEWSDDVLWGTGPGP